MTISRCEKLTSVKFDDLDVSLHLYRQNHICGLSFSIFIIQHIL